MRWHASELAYLYASDDEFRPGLADADGVRDTTCFPSSLLLVHGDPALMVRVRLRNSLFRRKFPNNTEPTKNPIQTRQHSLQIKPLATPPAAPMLTLSRKKPMRTDKQTEASRTNGAKLQGPRRLKESEVLPKRQSPQSRRGHIVLLSNESPDQFKAFPSGYLDAFANCPPRAHPSRNAFHPNRGSRSAAS